MIREEIAQAVSDIKRDVRESLRELSLEVRPEQLARQGSAPDMQARLQHEL